MSRVEVNSQEYWDGRFQSDWDAHEGRAQSRFFGHVALDLMPEWLRRSIRVEQWTICDWGCAEGDGTQVLAEGLGSAVEGVDFSQSAIEKARSAYPEIPFRDTDWLSGQTDALDSYDVVFSSNTLEHFHTPWEVFSALAERARRFVVLLLPFREYDRHHEHFATFDFESVRADEKGMLLVHAAVRNVSGLPGSQWPGEQVLLVYAHPDEFVRLRLALNDLRIDTKPSVDCNAALAASSERIDVLTRENDAASGMIKLLTEQSESANRQRRDIEIDRAAWIARAEDAEGRILQAEDAANASMLRVAELEGRVESLEVQGRAASEQVERLCLEIDERDAQGRQLNEQVGRLEADLCLAERKVADLADELKENASREESLAKRLQGFADELELRQAHGRDLERQVGELLAEKAALDRRIEELVVENMAQGEKMSEVLDQHAGLSEAYSASESMVASLGEENARLKRAMAEMRDELLRRDRGLSGLFWRARRDRPDPPSSRLGRFVWRLRREGLVRGTLNTGSSLFRRHAMSWYGYLFDVFVRTRLEKFPVDWKKVHVRCEPGLVSVVLPCFNGEDMVAESIDSVLSQTYGNFELILLNDGSTDATAGIFDSYAARDPRIRVVHQENMRLPRTLSRGFRMARGEFLTWTSADNRMKPDCLERMVEAFRRDDALDMVYTNLDIIGPDGEPLEGSGWYSNYQSPAGSEHIHLPRDTSELNTWANNFIGASFMYRARVAHLLRDYSASRFCTEDYDYWMRINSLFKLRHIGVPESLYEYRFHPNSLTSKDKELRITENRTRLMVFEDFRRCFLLSEGIWVLEAGSGTPRERDFIARLSGDLRASGHFVCTPGEFRSLRLAPQWCAMAWLRVSEDASAHLAHAPEAEGMISAVVAIGAEVLPAEAASGWTCCIAFNGRPDGDLPTLGEPYQGWIGVHGIRQLVASVDVLAKEAQLASIEAEAEAQYAGSESAELDATIVICTYRRSASLPAALESAVTQSLDKARYEVIVVNNEPSEPHPGAVVDGLKWHMARHPDHLRMIDCPITGLSHARNAGIAASRGKVVLFMDDDAVANPDCLERLVEAYRNDPGMGVIGGHIVLDPPQPVPEILQPGREGLWSHFVTGHAGLTAVRHWWEFPWGANWSARRDVLYGIGGFRTSYGRNGADFGGGEEIVAAALASQLGYEVGIEPRAVVLHQVERKRFTVEHVRKTTLAGTMVNYQMQKSMYTPFEASLTGTTKAVLRDALAAIRLGVSPKARRATDLLLSSAHRRARRHLWLRQVKDRMARLRTPIALE